MQQVKKEDVDLDFKFIVTCGRALPRVTDHDVRHARGKKRIIPDGCKFIQKTRKELSKASNLRRNAFDLIQHASQDIRKSSIGTQKTIEEHQHSAPAGNDKNMWEVTYQELQDLRKSLKVEKEKFMDLTHRLVGMEKRCREEGKVEHVNVKKHKKKPKTSHKRK